MPGPMQFGAVNVATPELTELRSTGQAIPAGASPAAQTFTTLLVTNPSGVGQGVQVGSFPGVTEPVVGILSTGFARGVWARASTMSQFATGIKAEGRTGVTASSPSGTASDAAVEGIADGINSNGVIGEANNGFMAYGVWGKSTTGLAGAFSGRVAVFGTLTKSGGGFQIDCPGRETDSYLRHSFVESPDMKNLYDGIVDLDEHGSAVVELPEWFSRLNRDYRYQLTSIGAAAPDLHISEEIGDGRFIIAGGSAGSRVCWQVTGTRQDPWAEANRIVVEEPKPEELRGRYLHPEAFGQPEENGEGYLREEDLRARRAARDAVRLGEPLPREEPDPDRQPDQR